MDVLRCVECPLKQWDNDQQQLFCTADGCQIDLSGLLLVNPQILCTVKCQQDPDAVIRECNKQIERLSKTVERAINLKTEREGQK
jgi:hypothetical protein